MIKREEHLFTGMHRDNYPINQEAKFLWDARNIRITNNDDNTLLSLTNEKGTSDPLLYIGGQYIGHCVLGDYLIIFTNTVEGDKVVSRIHRIEYNKDKNRYYDIILVEAENLFDVNYPIEAIGLYETQLIQKVYWVDGKHQPRFINIAKPELRFPGTLQNYKDKQDEAISLQETIDRIDAEGGDSSVHKVALKDTKDTLSILSKNIQSSFNIKQLDFSTIVNLNETIDIYKQYGYGQFSPGVIQYAFSYYNKYEQESAIFYVSPLQYITYTDRGAKADEVNIPVSFNITINKPDTNFEYIRVYAIHRTSLDSTPNTRIVGDIRINLDNKNQIYSLIDTGNIGESIDASYLDYVGGNSIIAGTICQKDNTLFLGNITHAANTEIKEIEEYIKNRYTLNNYTIQFARENNESFVYYYFNKDALLKNNTIFKTNETYRLGVQVQYQSGQWSDPIFLKDDILSTRYPFEYTKTNYSNSKEVILDKDTMEYLYGKGVRRVRTCVVFPRAVERDVICQGILNPTVYNVDCRKNNAPYSMASWIFRPTTSFGVNANSATNVQYGAKVEFRHDKPLRTRFYDGEVYAADRGMEVQNMYIPKNWDTEITKDNVNDYRSCFFVDENIVTLNSPDIEIDEQMINYNYEGAKLRIVGRAFLGATAGDITIQDSGTINPNAQGFTHTFIGHTTEIAAEQFNPSSLENYQELLINGGLISGCFYQDSEVKFENNKYAFGKDILYWFTCLWARQGSLNNDEARAQDSGAQSALLKKKIISNLKFFNKNECIQTIDNYNFPIRYHNITTPKLFNSSEVESLNIHPVYSNQDLVYMGNIDYLNITNSRYYLYRGETMEDSTVTSTQHDKYISGTEVQLETNFIIDSSDPVRIKYKSSPHLVFSLNGDDRNVQILPRSKTFSSLAPISSDEDPSTSLIKSSYNPIPVWSNLYNTTISRNARAFYQDCIYIDGTWQLLLETYGSIENLPENMIGSIIIVPQDNNTYNVYRVIYDSQQYKIKLVKLTTSTIQDYLTVKCYPGFTNIIKENDSYALLEGTEDAQYTEKVLEYQYGKEIRKINYKQYNTNTPVKLYRIIPAQTGEADLFTITYMSGEDYQLGNAYSLQQTKFSDLSKSSILDPFTQYTPPYLLIGELYKDNVENKFGGTSEYALQQNIWIPSSEPVNIDTTKDQIGIPYQYGDTWYSRYDCLKTYPFTTDDQNQVVEIGSFLLETRVNVDCRADINRGKLSNLTALPSNFNLFNSVYNQSNNFFTYQVLPEDFYKQKEFTNQIVYSTQKTLGEDIDTFSRTTLGSVFNLDGELGGITAIRKWNELLIAFQDKAVQRLLFNSKVQIPVSEGVPIEISNNYKMTGAQLRSNTIGCKNKWSIVETPSGLVFVDSNTNNIYILDSENIKDISATLGFNQWVKENNPESIWNPQSKENNGIRAFYDTNNMDIYFTKGLILDEQNNEIQGDALCYSDKLKLFTSFMSYSGVCAMFNFNNGFYSIKGDNSGISLYQNNVGEYNNFFGTAKPYSISFISNGSTQQEGSLNNFDKIFDTIEYRADLYNNNDLLYESPFNKIQVYNEYQDTHLIDINSKKKFRVWRALIPRDFKNKRDRIRNLWSCIKLENSSPQNNKMIFNSVSVNFSV